MTDQVSHRENPFRASRFRPGLLPFLFSSGESLKELVDQFRRCDHRAQIVGPHGSGKSTLLSQLQGRLAAEGYLIRAIKVGPANRSLAYSSADRPTATGGAPRVVLDVIDGFEQLPWWQRWRYLFLSRRRERGILITCHADCGLPTLWQTQTSLPVARHVVNRLTEESAADYTVSDADLQELLGRHEGNLREALFELYDRFRRDARVDGREGHREGPEGREEGAGRQ
ncbi:MAG: ATP/GTP-binding protein [Planctomycetales bacterium]|nr:ATP/GTP-binding protein [Planctomycetales bacterium]